MWEISGSVVVLALKPLEGFPEEMGLNHLKPVVPQVVKIPDLQAQEVSRLV